jgi:hypothetical protein
MTPAEILATLRSEGYPIATIASATRIKERYLRSGVLDERDQARLGKYASEQPCLKHIIGDTE